MAPPIAPPINPPIGPPIAVPAIAPIADPATKPTSVASLQDCSKKSILSSSDSNLKTTFLPLLILLITFVCSISSSLNLSALTARMVSPSLLKKIVNQYTQYL